jgi:mono/diheme cytochrome c family protein
VAAGLVGTASTAEAARPVIYVIETRGWSAYPPETAWGLYVPGAGRTVGRANAIEALRRGKVENSLLGGRPDGKVLAKVVEGPPPAASPGPYAVVTLPPPGQRPNTKFYSVAIQGYEGILTSEATRIRGLVPIAEIAPTLVALQEGRSPPIKDEADANADEDLAELDQRLTRIRDDRGWVLTAVILTTLVLIAVAPAAGVLAGAAAIAASLLLSAAGATQLWVLLVGIVALTVVFALLGSRFIPCAVAAFFAVYLVVLAASPETNSLAVLGARPDGGSRFHGMTNQLETLLLAPLIAGVAVGGMRWLVPLGALAVVTVGWSKAGADGGGILVYGAALAVLALRLRALALTPRRLAIAGATVIVLGVALVEIDAALGGSSHVTRALDDAPDVGNRLQLSWETATESWHRIVLFVGCVGALVWMGTMRPRRPTVDAMLVALVVSLVVNDTPVDVVGLGALGCAALLRWESVDSRAMRRGALTAAACLVAVLTLAACGEEGVVQPVPEEVVGTVAAEAPGRSVFASQGCGACHVFTPAGPAANGQIGPNLDQLPELARNGGEPLEEFTREGIVDPDAYVEKGYPKGVMPKSYRSLPPDDIDALVDFLTKQQG